MDDIQQRQPETRGVKATAAQHRLTVIEPGQADLRHARDALMFKVKLAVMGATRASRIEAGMMGIEA